MTTAAPSSPVDSARWFGPVGLCFLAFVGIATAGSSAAQVGSALGTALASALVGLAVLVPLIVLAGRGRVPVAVVLGFAGLFVLSHVAHLLPRVGPFAGWQWNWQGKTFELIWLAALLACLPRWSRAEAGIAAPARGSLRPVLLVIGAVFALQAILVWVTVVSGDPTFDGYSSPERLAFDSLHANLVEELLWRGVLLAILDRALGTPWRLFGARVGWGLVVTSLGFGLIHGLLITEDGLLFAPEQILLTGLLGLMMGWVRARSGSVWPAYAAHGAPELAIHAGIAVGSITA